VGHWNRDRDCEPAQLTGCPYLFVYRGLS
jgi:hypothetical protein